MNYDSLIVTLILAVEIYDVWLTHKKQKAAKLRRIVNRFLRKASNDTRKTTC